MPKALLWCMWKLAAPETHYEQGGGLDTGTYQHTKTKK